MTREVTRWLMACALVSDVGRMSRHWYNASVH
jgi:hypothetical protein